jgi:hypothetical protein
MKKRSFLTTAVLVVAFAFATLFVLLPTTQNTVYAEEPTFDDSAGRSVAENTPPGVNIGEPISATDPDETGAAAIEFGNTLTYSLEASADTVDARAEAAAFDIDPSTGQLITKSPLDFELKESYTVVVRVDDGEIRTTTCAGCTRRVVISVTDESDEPPAAPYRPAVVSSDDLNTTNTDESSVRIKVLWHPPENMGDRTIIGYTVQYKKSTETTFADAGYSGTDTTAFIGNLEADTSYDVRVNATTAEGTSDFSFVGTGSTNKEGNSPPQSTEDTSPATRMVAENTSAGENIGSPVTATDGDTTTLTYNMDGPDADLFNFNTRTGQIRTKAPLNHEDPRCFDGTDCRFYVTVTVVDGAGGSDATGVNIVVGDKLEAPDAPNRPTVRATENSSTSLEVSWNAPANNGPGITGYDVQYRTGSETFLTCGVTVKGTTATIDHDGDNNTADASCLSANTSYEVRVRAQNGERPSAWSRTGTGRTNRANQEPIFDDRPGTGTTSERNSVFATSRTIDENPRSGQVVGRIFANDADKDRLSYKLVESEDTDPARVELSMFTINEATGEIRTKAGVSYNYETITETGTCVTPPAGGLDNTDRCYTVKVEVRDGLDGDRVEDKDEAGDDSITLKIRVRDRDEPPSVPKMTVTSPTVYGSVATLVLYWQANNTGPDITNYDVQYRKGGGTFSTENCSQDGGDTSIPCSEIPATANVTSISGLDVDTSYSVQVRARNPEGVSVWSTVATLKTNKDDGNDPPTFNDTTAELRTRSVPENTPSGSSVGNPVTATDDASTNLTYSLGGRDADLFTIVSTTGQIRTRTVLNHEVPGCGYDITAAPDATTTCTYIVRVKVDDRLGGSHSEIVTINVTDVDEPPSAPVAPRVTATAGTGQSLDVSWSAPQNAGKPSITDYDIQYREVKTGTNVDDWEEWPHQGSTADDGNTETSTKITRRLPADTADPLKPRTQYEVRVRAKNGEGNETENWSSVARATTGQSNSRPSFDRTDALITLTVDENTRAGQNIGSAISATDADSDNLIYSLDGPGKDSFTIVSSSGQIRTKSPLDHEARALYLVTVKVDDRQRKANSVAAKSVAIMVDDIREPSPPPAAPTVAGIPGSTSSIRVTWAEPANTGPRITGYDVQYREVGSGPTRWEHIGADRRTIITGLEAGTRYEVQVRARSEEGTGDWSRWGSGSPNPDVANRSPAFSAGSRSLSIAENTPTNTDVGAPIAATDRDGDTLTYALEGTDADSFDVLSTSDGGQIRTSAALNHEEKARYSLTVRVRDGRGGTDAVNVTISVTDVNNEAPDTPFAPTVTAVSSTRLQVSWDEPDNLGPPITDYDYRYREPSGTWTEVTNTTITGTTLTIEGLAASTSYDVEVRAKNAEGTSDWSNPGIGSTNAPGANNLPVFADGVSATRSVSATASAGASIGQPVTATDADSGDTVTYSLEGRDAGLFEIDSTNGQLRTRSGVTLIDGETYSVTVTASDGTDTTRIGVSIEVTAAPPNNPPAFAEGASATRSVSGSAQAGTPIGRPVTATDADPGATLTYSLEGTNAASFSINSSTGQLLTRAGVTLPAASYPVTAIARDQLGATGRITVTITILSNAAPDFSSTRTTRNVSENVPAGTAVGGPVTASDADNDTLTYTLGGADSALFAIGSGTGQITVGSGTALDYETRTSYTVVVTATDPSGESGTTTVTIRVTNVATEGDRFDTNDDGAITWDEVFGAIQQFLTGQASRDDVLGVILRSISG